MTYPIITGYGDDLTIDGVRLGDLSPSDHENIEKNKGGQNYKPLEDVVVSHVKDSSTLICRKPSNDSVSAYIEEELIDGLCCYSAVNQGQLNEEIVNAKDNKLEEICSDGTDDIIYGRSECAEALLRQIKRWGI